MPGGLAGTYNLVIQQGADYDKTLTWYLGPGQTNPVDLTLYTARAKLRDPDKDEQLELTTGNGRIVLGGVNGTIQLLIANAITAAFDPTSQWRWDLELIDGAAVVTRLLQGTVTVTAEQTY